MPASVYGLAAALLLAGTAAAAPLSFTVREGRNLNALVRDGTVAAHLVVVFGVWKWAGRRAPGAGARVRYITDAASSTRPLCRDKHTKSARSFDVQGDVPRQTRWSLHLR